VHTVSGGAIPFREVVREVREALTRAGITRPGMSEPAAARLAAAAVREMPEELELAVDDYRRAVRTLTVATEVLNSLSAMGADMTGLVP
jgi:hypothetical protein